jgi:hypothetical protein
LFCTHAFHYAPHLAGWDSGVHVVLTYDRYAWALAAIDLRGYPYRVRIFDKILWIIGFPAYDYDAKSSIRTAIT